MMNTEQAKWPRCVVDGNVVTLRFEQMMAAERGLAHRFDLQRTRVDRRAGKVAAKNRVIGRDRSLGSQRLLLQIDPRNPINQEKRFAVGQHSLDIDAPDRHLSRGRGHGV